MSTGSNSKVSDKVSFASRAKDFAGEVSIAGVKYVAMDTSVIRRAIWAVVVVVATSITAYQVTERVMYYTSYPTAVNVRMNFNNSLRFPTVTICNENTVAKNELVKHGPEVVDLVERTYPAYPDPDFRHDVNFSDYDWLYDGAVDWAKMYEDIAQPKDQCIFKGQRCSASNFTTVATNLGYCFQFNTEAQNFEVDRPGTAHPLQLLLYVEQDQYMVQSSFSAGFRVLLHQPGEIPKMQEWAFKIPAGQLTMASVTSKEVTELPSPHGNCHQKDDYSKDACLLQCEADYILRKCNCIQSYYPGNASVCNPEERIVCAEPGQKQFITKSMSSTCTCPHHCHQIYYFASLSASPPSKRVLDNLIPKIDPYGEGLTRSGVTDDYGMVEIFYSEMAYEEITTIEAYNLLALICDLGGAMGLLLGSTIITILEILDFALVTGRDALRYKTHTCRVHESDKT